MRTILPLCFLASWGLLGRISVIGGTKVQGIQDEGHIEFDQTRLSSARQHAKAGAVWTKEEMLWVRAELYKAYGYGNRKGFFSHSRPNAAKVLRMNFHDCYKYTDGTGGCDGCLNYDGMDGVYDITAPYTPAQEGVRLYDVYNERREVPDGSSSHGSFLPGDNNGLHNTAKMLEDLWETTPTASSGMTGTLQSLKQRGISRADLWAFAGIVAVEFGIEANNRVCRNESLYSQHNGDPVDWCWGDTTCNRNTTATDGVQCPQRKLPQLDSDQRNCEIGPISNIGVIRFETGRVDCGDAGVSVNASRPWQALKNESAPSHSMNGSQIVTWMFDNFGLTSKETVALMGAHALGRYNTRQSMLKYSWTSREEAIFNNQYYRNLMSRADWHVDDNNCTPVGTAFGNKPQAKFMAKMNRMTENGGPIQWVQYKHSCINCKMLTDLLATTYSDKSDKWKNEQRACCHDLPADLDCWPDPDSSGNNRTRASDSNALAADADPWNGCEQWRIIRGRESTMLNTDMGLYLKFDVAADGKPANCPGLEMFNTSWLDFNSSQAWQSHIGYEADGSPKYDQGCAQNDWRNTAQEGRRANKLYKLVEKYARNERRWVRDFFAAMTKMLSNGYQSGSLTVNDDHWTGVTCDWPIKITGGVKHRQLNCTNATSGMSLKSTARIKTLA